MKTTETRKWWALGALAASGLVIGLDVTVLNVALPSLATELPATTSELQWIANSYNLVFAAMLLPAGLLGDRFGRKSLLLAALALFATASLACAYASSAEWLIGARALLGLGAAFVVPLCMAVLPVLFTPQERGRAIGLWVTANAVGLPLGPIIGGWLLDHYWWGSVFLINIPVIAVALAAVLLLVPQSRSSQRRRLDLVGMLVSGVALASLTWGAIALGERGIGGTPAAAIGVGLAMLALFVAWERQVGRRPAIRPLVDLGLFRSASFAWATVLATLVTFALLGALFALPQYFQAVLDADALGTGLRLLPLIGGVLLGARLGARLAPRLGAKAPVATGFLVLAAGLFAGTATGAGTGYGFVAGWLTAVGLGMGLVLPIATDVALGTLSAEGSGAGSALIQALRQVGGTIGVAILGSVLNSVYRDRLDLSGLPAPAADAVRDSAPAGVLVARQLDAPELLEMVRRAFVDAMDAMLWVCGGVALLGAVLAVAFLPRQTEPATAAPVGRPGPKAGESGQVTVG
ncbi:MFS transporter [Plantactinospora sp. S1510]|uniref:MFS transporter n=1 Tax=Plantactinospora alkalitolerans TaxID=2789879 RepID=A0ABS0GML4_9ACTN|nr:MFS transporter [Plantactinospora alkalitolerans]MBF9127427.1 MFS transporter [Plantactinospora alkalitolerans]